MYADIHAAEKSNILRHSFKIKKIEIDFFAGSAEFFDYLCWSFKTLIAAAAAEAIIYMHNFETRYSKIDFSESDQELLLSLKRESNKLATKIRAF